MSFLFGETEKTDKERSIAENVDFKNSTTFQLESIPETIALPLEQLGSTKPTPGTKNTQKKIDRKTYNLRATPQREQLNRGEPVYKGK